MKLVTSLFPTHHRTGRSLSRLCFPPITGLSEACHVSVPHPSRDWAKLVKSLFPTHHKTERSLLRLCSPPITGLGERLSRLCFPPIIGLSEACHVSTDTNLNTERFCSRSRTRTEGQGLESSRSDPTVLFRGL